MPRPEVLDTTVFIRFAHAGTELGPLLRRVAGGNVWLSSVVLAELFAGTRSPEEARLLDRLGSVMTRTGRLLTPTAEEWVRAGRLMARRIRLRGAVRPRDHFNDLLILVSAARVAGTVITANVHHFEPWAVLARSAGLDVLVRADAPEAP